MRLKQWLLCFIPNGLVYDTELYFSVSYPHFSFNKGMTSVKEPKIKKKKKEKNYFNGSLTG